MFSRWQLQMVSKWCRNLFWDVRSEYSFSNTKMGDMDVASVMRKCNPRATRGISLARTAVTDLVIHLLASLDLARMAVLSLEYTEITDECNPPPTPSLFFPFFV